MLRSHAEPLIEFVNSHERLKCLPVKKSKRNDKIQVKLTGDEVRTLYESVISDSSESGSAKPAVSNQCHGGEHVKPRGSTRSRECAGLQRRRHSAHLHSSYSCEEHAQRKSEKTRTELTDGDNSRNISKNPPKSKNEKETQVQLLQDCQAGDLDSVLKGIASGGDVNGLDQYGWSPLMCAACAGNLDVVQLLLKAGADWTLRDKSGKTAHDLAERSGHRSITNAIDDRSCGLSKTSTSVDVDGHEVSQNGHEEGSYCDVCKKSFTGVMKSHATSTVHLFNRQLKPAEHNYLISESNRGYQMMLRSGWEESQGLGPTGEGHKFPVKTVLKRDREGLGRERTGCPRVTHFRPGDVAAVKAPVTHGERRETLRSISRKEIRKRERRDKQWEIRLRQYMNSE